MKIILLIAVFSFGLSFSANARYENDSLTISTTKGPSPLTLRIEGPKWFLQQSTQPQDGWGGNGVSIVWGDGLASSSDIQHTYTVPGIYTLKVVYYTLGPADGRVVEWSDERKIEVTGPARESSLKVTNFTKGSVLKVFDVSIAKWKLKTGQVVDLTANLTDLEGRLVAQGEAKGLAFDGEGQVRLHPSKEFDHLNQAIPDGKAGFQLHMTLTSKGKVVFKSKTGPFTIIADPWSVEDRLKQAIKQNLLRPATQSDLDGLSPVDRPGHISVRRSYVILDGFSFPIELKRAGGLVFILRKGAPFPIGELGERNTLIDLNKEARCIGDCGLYVSLAQSYREGAIRKATDEEIKTANLGHDIDIKTFVVLKKFTLPKGLYGAHAVRFLVPKGVPRPDGDPGHSTLVDYNKSLICQGPHCPP